MINRPNFIIYNIFYIYKYYIYNSYIYITYIFIIYGTQKKYHNTQIRDAFLSCLFWRFPSSHGWRRPQRPAPPAASPFSWRPDVGSRPALRWEPAGRHQRPGLKKGGKKWEKHEKPGFLWIPWSLSSQPM